MSSGVKNPKLHIPQAQGVLPSGTLVSSLLQKNKIKTNRGGVADEKIEAQRAQATRLYHLAERIVDATGDDGTCGLFTRMQRTLRFTTLDEIVEAIRPTASGTLKGHMDTITRYERLSLRLEFEPWPVDPGSLYNVLTTFAADEPGASALQLIMRALGYLYGHIQPQLPDLSESQAFATRYYNETFGKRRHFQAEEWSDKFVAWLEIGIRNTHMLLGDRLLLARAWLMAGGSTRHADQRHASVDFFETVIWANSKRLRALIGYCWRTKTRPRSFVVSSEALTPEGEGWLETALQLIAVNCAESFTQTLVSAPPGVADWIPKRLASENDAWPPRVSESRAGLVPGPPPKHYTDVTHLRFLMRASGLFSDAEIFEMKLHGSKATLIGRGFNPYYLANKNPEPALLQQGGWRPGRNQAMPFLYARQKVFSALELTEAVLTSIATNLAKNRLDPGFSFSPQDWVTRDPYSHQRGDAPDLRHDPRDSGEAQPANEVLSDSERPRPPPLEIEPLIDAPISESEAGARALELAPSNFSRGRQGASRDAR